MKWWLLLSFTLDAGGSEACLETNLVMLRKGGGRELRESHAGGRR